MKERKSRVIVATQKKNALKQLQFIHLYRSILHEIHVLFYFHFTIDEYIIIV